VIENSLPFDTSASDPERRRFLEQLERALELRELLDVTWEYRPVAPMPGPHGFTCLGLVIRVAGLPGEVMVVPLTITSHFASTQPGGEGLDFPELGPLYDAMRAKLRRFGVLGVTAPMRRYDPFPEAGVPAYQAVIWEPRTKKRGEAAPPAQVEQLETTDPNAVVDLIVAWRDASRAEHPPEPRAPTSLSALRTQTTAGRSLEESLDRDRIEQLRRTGQVAEAWLLAGLETDPSLARLRGDDWALGPEAAERLGQDLAHLDPVVLLRHVPRDDRGKLALGETVLLASYESDPPLGPNKQVWLAARTPARRRDPQVVSLALTALVGDYYSHRWGAARWLWDDRSRSAPQVERWGLAELPMADLGFDAWRARTEALQAAIEDPDSCSTRAAACILLQDAGRLALALALYDVEIDPEVGRLLRGAPLGYSWRREAEPWARAVQEGLRACAPWRFEPLLRAAATERAQRASGKRARRPEPPRLRLFWLPHQTSVSKGAVILTARDPDGGRPRLELEWSASLSRLPAVAWQRPVELDLARFGLAA
jgi:hypothetical protein